MAVLTTKTCNALPAPDSALLAAADRVALRISGALDGKEGATVIWGHCRTKRQRSIAPQHRFSRAERGARANPV